MGRLRQARPVTTDPGPRQRGGHVHEPVNDDAEPAIRLERLSKHYPEATVPAVAGLDLDVPDAEVVALVGPSGCGKTTILKMVNRLIDPTSGRVLLRGVDTALIPLHELRRGIGYVIQQGGLFPHRSVADNIATVPKLLGWSKDRTRARVDELTEVVGLDPEILSRYPSALSGGQQQRVGVARALAADPPVLLMDEPYSAVDPVVRARLQDELLDLQRRLRKTILIVTHDIDEAIKLADRIALLNVGGVLEQYGTPDELLRAPASPFVERFLGDNRALKRLSLSVVGDLPASALHSPAVAGRHGAGPLVGPGVGPERSNGGDVVVRTSTTLRDALDVLLGSPDGRARVVDDDGVEHGEVTVDSISASLR